jgi:tetratricopeptide (TPR) repeat protein
MDLSKHLEKADEAKKRRNYPLAIGLYHQILELDPDLEDARRGLREAIAGKFEAKGGKPAGASPLAYLQGFLPLLSAGIAKLTKGHASRAKNLERFLAIAPGAGGANMALGEALANGGWYRSAYVVYRHYGEMVAKEGKASNRAPQAGVAWRHAGALARELGRLQEAFECYEQALELNPRDQDALRARKNLAAEGVLAETGFDKAQSSRELIKDQQKQRELEKGQRIHRDAEDLANDLETLEKQLSEKPGDPEIQRKVGELRARKGDTEGALEVLEPLQLQQAEDFKLLVLVGDLKIKLLDKDVERARKLGDEAGEERAMQQILQARIEEHRKRVALHPTDLKLRHMLGRELLEAGQLDDAIAELQKSVKDPRHQLEATTLLGQAFRRKGMGDLARSQLQKALESASSDPEQSLLLNYELGLLAEDEGRTDDARAHYGRILEVDITFQDVSERMQKLSAS